MTADAPGEAEYQALVARLDAFDERVQAAQGDGLVCAPGCDGCCRVRRTAWTVEIAAIAQWLAVQAPAVRDRLVARRAEPAVEAGERCLFLHDDGRCDVYPVRPVICRTHGPVVRTAQAPGGYAWCPLNFTGDDPAQLPGRLDADGVLDLDRVDEVLVLINQRFVDGGGADFDRAPLDLALDAAIAVVDAAEDTPCP